MQLPTLITNYIKNLDTEAQDRLLTTKLVAHSLWNGEAGCLVGVAHGWGRGWYKSKTPDVFGRDEALVRDLDLWDGSLLIPADEAKLIPFLGHTGRLPMVFNRLFLQDPAGTTEAIRTCILEHRAQVIAATVEPLVPVNV